MIQRILVTLLAYAAALAVTLPGIKNASLREKGVVAAILAITLYPALSFIMQGLWLNLDDLMYAVFGELGKSIASLTKRS